MRLSRITSTKKDFKSHIDQMKEWLTRNYPENVGDDQINKVVFGKNLPGKKNSENDITFAMICQRNWKNK